MKLIQVILFCFFGAGFFNILLQKLDPDSTLNRNSGDQTSELSSPSTGFNSGDDLSPAGGELDGNLLASDELLSPRDPGLDAFGDPLNVIRPFNPVYFGFDQYNISASERDKLVEIAEFLQNNQEARLLVEGYCDWKGTPAYNKALEREELPPLRNILLNLVPMAVA